MDPNDSTADELKERGNDAYRNGDFAAAEQLFSAALEKDSESAPLYCNRSMCRGAAGDWAAAAQDAVRALKIDPSYLKAHYRLVKATIELKQLKEAQYYLLAAYTACGPSKDLKPLEAQFQSVFGCSFKPKPSNFRMIEGLGEGNFSKIFKVEFKATKTLYALKVIEKLGAEKIKRRHPNVHNEILMEKKVLNALSHPNIVMLFSTFQDELSLYYQMEYLDGGEVWSLILDSDCNKMVGCPRSITRFILGETLNALEYMHQKGIVHRDLKPENMMLTSSGHLKLVDFGTCKDLVKTNLNGPQFVGTAEFMSPETIKSQKTGPATDLWSLGIVAFYMLFGYTPFIGASPYMTFLRIKRAMLKTPYNPDLIPEEVDLLGLLLERDAIKRYTQCTSSSLDSSEFPFLPDFPYADISYDTLRQRPYFTSDKEWQAEATKLPKDKESPVGSSVSPEFLKTLVTRPARRVPLLSELCIRTLKKPAALISSAVCTNGGTKPDTPWMKRFDVFRLSEHQRAQLALQLQRCGTLHQPQVYRMFQSPGVPGLMESRLVRTSLFTREYVGFDHAQQGHWDSNFFFTVLHDPLFGFSSAQAAGDGRDVKAEETRLRAVITSLNKLRPRFVVVSGNLTDSSYGESAFEAQLESARKCLCRVSETIPLVFTPGPNTVGRVPTPASIDLYNSKFGADYFGFFYGGFRCLVINSPLMVNPSAAPDQAARQDLWFAEEIEQSKLHAAHIAVFSHHAWFLKSIDDEDSAATMPKTLREKWLPSMRHSKIKYLFCSASEPSAGCPTIPDWERCGGLVHKNDRGSKAIDRDVAEALDKISLVESSGVKHSAEDEAYVMKVDDRSVAPVDTEEPPMKPSEIVAQGAAGNDSSSDDDETQPADDGEELTAEEEEFMNVDSEYDGPTVVLTCSCSVDPTDKPQDPAEVGVPALPPPVHMATVRIVKVAEADVFQEICPANAIPTSVV